MPRASTMIQMNSDAFRDIVQARQSLASLEGILAVSRQAINGWLSQSRIPPRKLSALSKELKFSPDEMNQILTPPKAQPYLLFRTNRNVAVPKEVKNDVLDLATDYFRLEEMTAIKRKEREIKISTEGPKEMADAILRQLGLDARNLTLEATLNALRHLNVHVLFYDFGQTFVDAKAQAVCVQLDGRSAIFINSYELIEDVLWRIFHEICHLFSGHKEGSKDEEIFCNETASQAITPDKFFAQNRKELKRILTSDNHLLKFIVEEIARDLSASFIGVLLGLKRNKIIDATTERFLWRIAHKRKKSLRRIHDVISPKKDEDPSTFWKNVFEDCDNLKYLSLQQLVRVGLSLNKISSNRAAEMLQVDEMTVQQLDRLWKS